MTALLIVSIISMIGVIVLCVAVTVLVSRALTRAFRALDQMHVRTAQQQSDLLDRLMTIRWEDLLALRSTDEPQVGGFYSPTMLADEEDTEGGVEEPPGGTFLSRLNERLRLTDEESELLSEDFGDEGGVV